MQNFGTQSSLQGKIELDFEAANDLVGDIGIFTIPIYTLRAPTATARSR